MSYNLLELTQNYFLGGTVRQLSTAFGEPDTRLSAALRSVVPLVLGGLLTRTREPGGAAELTEWAQQVHKRGLLTDLSSLLAGLRTAPTATDPGEGSLPHRGADMMRSLLKDAYEPALAGISQQAGMPAMTVSNLFSVVVAAVLGLLGRHIAQQSLDATGVRSYLGSQRADILGALATLPAGLGQDPAHLSPGAPATTVAPVSAPAPAAPLSSLASSLPTQTRVSETATHRAPTAAPSEAPAAAAQPVVRVAPPHQAVRPAVPAPVAATRWPWLLLLALGLAAVGYFTVSRRPQAVASEPSPTPVAAARPAAPAARLAASSGQYEAATGTYRYAVGAATTLRLPTGTSLTVGSRSTEAQLWQLLTDRTQARTADQTLSGIPLDRVYFDPGHATLTVASQAQLTNLAALLEAFPRATLKVGGFTDDQGSAEANLLLSADRANAVRNTLVAKGLAPTRVAAQGYGQTHPAVSNATPAGQAQNRRVAVLLTSQ